jgi:hypothetical protein
MIAYQEQQAWVVRMEKTEQSDFKVIRLNASLYSFVEDTDMKLVNEDIIINHKSYHVFKTQIKDNVLSLYYLANAKENTIGKELNDLVNNQLFNTNSSKESPVKKALKSFIKDYIDQPKLDFSTPAEALASLGLGTAHEVKFTQTGYFSLPYSPPDWV